MLHAGNLVGLVLSPLIVMQFGWKALFYTFGLLGAPLIAIWLALAPKPAAAAGSASSTAAAGVQKSESAAGSSAGKSEGGVSVWKLMSHPATWAIIIVNIVNHWGYFIYLNWMPSYFSKVRYCKRFTHASARIGWLCKDTTSLPCMSAYNELSQCCTGQCHGPVAADGDSCLASPVCCHCRH